MERNDFWTHIGLVMFSLLVVVGPRLFSPDHVVNTLIFLTGGLVVVVAAIIVHFRTIPERPASWDEA